jgi:hypothetical protein
MLTGFDLGKSFGVYVRATASGGGAGLRLISAIAFSAA